MIIYWEGKFEKKILEFSTTEEVQTLTKNLNYGTSLTQNTLIVQAKN